MNKIKVKLRNSTLFHNCYDVFLKIIYIINIKLAIRFEFFISMGYPISFKNPKTFNEKIQVLKFIDNNDLRTRCADKYLVREYLKEKNCENILNELYGVYNNVEDIKFDNFPKRFVLKTNHSCGTNIIINDKEEMNEDLIRIKLRKFLEKKYGRVHFEPQYFNIKPLIICEKHLGDKITNKVPEDYKFYCTNGKLMTFSIIEREEGKLPIINHFNEKCEFIENSLGTNEHPLVPSNINDMIKIAKYLSEKFKFVRVDLYDINNKIIFGELTFTPTGGFYNYISKELDIKLGEMIEL